MDFSKFLSKTNIFALSERNSSTFTMYEFHNKCLWKNSISIITPECKICVIVAATASGKTGSLYYNAFRKKCESYYFVSDEMYPNASYLSHLNLDLITRSKFIQLKNIQDEILELFKKEKNITIIIDDLSFFSFGEFTYTSFVQLEKILKENDSRLILAFNKRCY